MSVTIKYKGNTIASANTDTTKTLKTSGKYCEGDIVVENIQDGGITPSGSIAITENGTYDVTEYASADVNVSGGTEITDGIVVKETATFGTGLTARVSATKVDYYGKYMPYYTFGAARGDNYFAWQDLTEINFKNDEIYVSWGNFMYCKAIKEISTSAIKGRDPRLTWNFNSNQQQTAIFRYMTSLETLSLPEFEGFLNHYEIANCTKLKNVYLPKVTKACSYGDASTRGSFDSDTALQNVQLGSIGYAVDALDANTFRNCTSAFTLTMYSTPSYADTLLSKARNGATNATIIIKDSTTGDVIVTSTP